MSYLAQNAMLVSVNITNGGLLGERKNAKATALVHKTYSIADKRAKASTYLIDRKHPKVKAVVAASQRVREVLYKYTLPWGDDNTRLLAANLHDEFSKKMREAETELREAWDKYLQVYPSLIADSERKESGLGGLFDATQYPSVRKARELFAFKLTYWPVPSAGSFIADISDEAAKKAKAEMGLEIETRIKDATRDLVDRARQAVATFVDRLQSFQKKGDGKIIKDILISNLREMSQLINSMNITNNRDISEMAYKIERVCRYSGEVYRRRPDILSDGIFLGKQLLEHEIDLDNLNHQVADMVAEASEYEF
jgi:hypothetical protein